MTDTQALPDAESLPETMPAAVYTAKGEVTIEERPVPRPGPGQVLVEVGHCGICGSDIHIILEGWGKPGAVEGHEWSGVVAAVGDGVATWTVGDGVVGGPSPQVRALQAVPGGKAVAVREPRPLDDG